MFEDLSWLALTISACALVIGGLAKGSVGIGLPLLAVPIIANFMSVPQTLALLTIPIFFTNVWQALEGRNLMGILKRFWPLGVTLAIGIGIGAQLLIRLEDRTLYFIMGCVVLVQPMLRLTRPNFELSPARARVLAPLVGLVSGVVGGVSGFFGPLIMAYAAMMKLPKDLFTASIATMFVIGGASLALFFTQVGVMGSREFLASLVAMVPVALGLWIGQRIRAKISQVQFERALTAILFLTGMSLLAKAFYI